MPECSRDNQYSTLPPPGFTTADVALKNRPLIELLQKVIDKFQYEPEFITQQPKETNLLVSIAQLTLLSTPISPDVKRDFLNNIITIGQDLLSDENQVNKEIAASIDTYSPTNENKNTTSTVLPSDTLNNDVDGDFSLDDLANEYLRNEPTPSSSNDKPTTPSESDLSKNDLSSSPSTPSTNVLSGLILPPPSNESNIIKPPLESILFSNRLSSHDAADDADCIWKEDSSPFGQMFCTKIDEIQIIAKKRISTCLFDRSLYERVTRLIILLPKQCIHNSVQQLSIRPNELQPRPPRPNYGNRHPSNRPSFQQNSLQSHPMPRYPPAQNIRQYSNFNYSNQQGNPNGHFIDRRSQQQNRYPPASYAQYPVDQQQQQNRYPPASYAQYPVDQQQQNRYPPPAYAQYPVDQQQQQNRYPPPSYAQYPADQQHQQKGPAKNNSYNNGHQQQKKKPQANNQQASNQYHQQQRGTKKGSGGNKLPNEKSGAPESDPSSNSK